MADIQLRIKSLDKDLELPVYAKPGDAGLDLRSAIDADIEPGCRKLIPTGIALGIPAGFAGFIQPRSGLALKQGMTIVNTPGLIDSGYRGEIGVVALNTDLKETIHIKRGDRVAQLVIQAVPVVEVVEVQELDLTERSETGFGSSGL